MSDDRRAAILAAWTDKPESYWQAALPRFDSATLRFGRSSLIVDRGPSALLFEDWAVVSLDEAAEVLIARGLLPADSFDEARRRFACSWEADASARCVCHLCDLERGLTGHAPLLDRPRARWMLYGWAVLPPETVLLAEELAQTIAHAMYHRPATIEWFIGAKGCEDRLAVLGKVWVLHASGKGKRFSLRETRATPETATDAIERAEIALAGLGIFIRLVRLPTPPAATDPFHLQLFIEAPCPAP